MAYVDLSVPVAPVTISISTAAPSATPTPTLSATPSAAAASAAPPSVADAAAELLSRRRAAEHLRDFVARIEPTWTLGAHQLLLIDYLMRFLRHEIRNLMVLMPPGSSKSSFVSILFPAFYLGHNPTMSCIAASHTAELAERFGRKARNIVASPAYSLIFPGTTLSPSSQAAGRWETSSGGEFYAAGVGGSVTGRRANCLTGDTTVITPHNHRLPIRDVTPGTHVFTPLGWRQVTRTASHQARVLYYIATAAGDTIQATHEHPFFVSLNPYPALPQRDQNDPIGSDAARLEHILDAHTPTAQAHSTTAAALPLSVAVVSSADDPGHGDHSFAWVPAAELTPGQVLLRCDPSAQVTATAHDRPDPHPVVTSTVITSVYRAQGHSPDDTVDVYDIEVDEAHSFYANNLLVHNCLFIDDVVRSREDADSVTVRNKTWDWYVNDLLTRLKPDGQQLLCITPWHEDDLSARIRARDAAQWTVIELPMESYGEDEDPLHRPKGERLWPEYFTDEMVTRAKQDPRSWQALYQLRPRPTGGGEFKRDWLQYYGAYVNHHGMGKVMLVDPASSKRTTSDYTSVWVIGLGADDNYYVLDLVRDRMNLTERADLVFRLHRKWKPQQVRYERYGMMADIEYLKAEMNRRAYRFRVVEVAGATSKEDRIRRLVPLFERGHVWFPTSLLYTPSGTTEPIDLVRAFVEEEYLPFPVGTHDDMLDSLARIAEPQIDLPWPAEQYTQRSLVPSWAPLNSSMGY